MTLTLLYDTKLRQPACVLLQAALGGDSTAVQRFWAPSLWLVHPTNDMQKIAGTEEQWEKVAKQDRELERK